MSEKTQETAGELRERRDQDEEIEELEAEGFDPEAYGPGFDVPEYDSDGDEDYWHGWIPPDETLEETEPTYIEGIYPNTQLSRRAMEAVPKRARRDPLIGMKESQENLLRICITRIGNDRVGFKDLRGKGLDKFLSQKQMHYVVEYFDRLTTPEEADVHDFLSTIQTGRRKG